MHQVSMAQYFVFLLRWFSGTVTTWLEQTDFIDLKEKDQEHTTVVVASNSLNVHLSHHGSLSDVLSFIQGQKSGLTVF